MKRPILNLVTSAVIFAAAVLWLAIGSGISGLLWFALSLMWLGVAFYQWVRRDHTILTEPWGSLGRRISRSLLFWS